MEHPNFPREALRTFVDEPSPHVRYLALRDPESSDPESEVVHDAAVVAVRPGATNTFSVRLRGRCGTCVTRQGTTLALGAGRSSTDAFS